MPKGYVIFTSTVKDQAGLDAYAQKALPILAKAGGRPIAFDAAPAVLEGEWRRPVTMVVEFESVEAAHRWYDSSEYGAVRGERHAAADTDAVIVSGLDLPAA